jgi:hypothetical protein
VTEDISFAKWLRQRCWNLGISVEQLHRLIIYSVSSIEKVLRGDKPSRNFVLDVADLFVIPDEQLAASVAWARGERGQGGSAYSGTEEDARNNLEAQVNNGMPWLAPSVSPADGLRIFLCHASEDKPKVRNLYFRLRAAGFNPWLDEEDLLPGQNWEAEITRAVRESDVVLVCLSKNATNKTGFVQKEVVFALDVADKQPEGTIYLIPVRLDNCEVPDRLQRWQWVDLYSPAGYSFADDERLIRALNERAKRKANSLI